MGYAPAMRAAGPAPEAERGARRSAGVVVVRATEHGWLYLLLRAYRNWDFPKGRVEPGEAPLATAVRELAEETGIADPEFKWGECHAETTPYAGGKIARYYLAATRTEHIELPVSPELGRPEHHEWRWVTADEAGVLLPQRLHPVLRWAQGILAPA